MISNETVTIRATVAFPNFERVDSFSEKYSVQFANLSEAAVEKLEELGISIAEKEDDKYGRGQYITSKSKFPIIPVDANGNSFEGQTQQIGYGSIVKATIKPVPYTMGGRSGVTPRVVRVEVEELVQSAVAGGGSDEVL